MCQLWGGGRVEKKPLQYFEFGLQCLVQPLGINPTYSTFNRARSCRNTHTHMSMLTSGIARIKILGGPSYNEGAALYYMYRL